MWQLFIFMEQTIFYIEQIFFLSSKCYRANIFYIEHLNFYRLEFNTFGTFVLLFEIEKKFLNLCYRESDEKKKDELVAKLKANIPEAKITSETGPGGYFILKTKDKLNKK